MKRFASSSALALTFATTLLPSSSADDFPTPPDTEPSTSRALPPAEAAAGFRVPKGFRVSVFAAEPEVRNPIAMAWDRRGRLWVAENYTYAELPRNFDLRLRDRVLIFEDTDGDGRADRRTVFTDGVQRLGSVELGLGGAWLLCPPRLLFVPDRDGNDVPDGPAQVVLDGFGVAAENHHTFANGLRWGPDGWLYGRCGASSPGEVGIPGTPAALRVPMRGGIWRYHPARKRFEMLAHGTTNPWGHDWSALGEAFFINTVNGHLWHLIPGSHLVRPHTIEPNPRAYALIDQHADHWHWDNSRESTSGFKVAPEDGRLGGGHAHSGMMIYLADQWPPEYRGKLFTMNFHGRRINVERLERDGSGYVGRHEPDMLFAKDPWFRGIDMGYGPDGGVYMLDWSDTGECHDHEGVHRSSGRIYKVTHGAASAVSTRDISTLGEGELAEMHRHPNEWFVRQARRELIDRAAQGAPLEPSRKALRVLFDGDPAPENKLRALWTLYAIGSAGEPLLRGLLDHDHESVRAWAIRILTDELPIDTIDSKRVGPDVDPSDDLLAKLASMAREDRSGLVRLVLASTIQRLPVRRRLALAGALLSRAEDANDHNLPSLIWTGLIPVADVAPGALASLAADARMLPVVGLIARRLGEDIDERPAPINDLLATSSRREVSHHSAIVSGLQAALTGRRKARRPEAWEAFRDALASLNDRKLHARVRDLDVLFGDGRALDEVRRLALDESASLEDRKVALRTLIEGRPNDLRTICERLLRVRFLNSVAVRGLALFDDPEIGRLLARNYRSFHPSERASAIEVLVSRPAFAQALLDQVAAGRIRREEITAFYARQILSLGDSALSRRLGDVWGELRGTAADRRGRIAEWKKQLDGSTLAAADRSRGRALFDRLCASCHRLHGQGADIGPDLTGSGRDNLDYLLENIVDPGAAVGADFRMVVVAMRDGRILNGLVKAQSQRMLTLQTQTEALSLDRSEVEGLRPSASSLMPDGLLDPLKPEEVRDLIGYLSHPTQVPLPPGTSPTSTGR